MPQLKFKSPEGKVITVNSPDGSIPSEQELDQLFAMSKSTVPAETQSKKVGSVFGKVSVDDYTSGKRNILGNIFERPGAAVRGLVRGLAPGGKTPIEGFSEGSVNPASQPTFQSSLLEKFAPKTKSTALNFLGGIIPSTVGLLADVATNPADVLSILAPKAPGVSNLLGSISRSGVGQITRAAVNAPITKIPQVVKQSIGALENVEKSLQTVERGISATVRTGISKGIRPTVVGKGSARRTQEYFDKVGQGVQEIIRNKENLGFIDEAGETVVRLPQNMGEYAKAIESTKKNIYKQYSDLAQQSTDAGALFNAKPIVSKIDTVSKDIKFAPETRKYAEGLKENIAELQNATPDVIQARIEDLNKSLNGFYMGRVDKAKAEVDASIAKLMRQELDNIIEKTTGGPYQALKNKYGSLKAAEKEVNQRAMVALRQNPKGIFDLTDIFSGGQIISGVAHGNPASVLAGLAQYGIKGAIKRANNPNLIIKKMFSNVERLMLKSEGLQKRITSR